jgi:creatinine amidohydrolase
MKTRFTFRAGGLAVPVLAAIMTAVLAFAGQPAKAVKSLVLEDLTWVAAEKALKDYDVALIALGARTKEHGPHLTLKTDYIQAEYLMRRVAAEVPVVVLPTLQYGYYPSFLEYPGSISIGAGTFKNVVMDICKSMRGYGLKKFYVLNTGVSTIGPLAEAEKELAAAGIALRSLNVLEVDRELPAGLLKQEGGTHADEGETSMMLYIAPETVDMSKAVKDFDPRPGRHGLTRDPKGEGSYSPTGIYGDPTLASKEKGRVIVEATVRAAVRQVRELIAEKPIDPIAGKYAASLEKIFGLGARFAPLHPVLGKVHPVAIVENKTFYIFEPDPAAKTYRLVQTAPDSFDIPTGIRAAMPLAFWENRMACVVTGEVFDQPDGYVFIFHEFVHCAQWECCEQKLKEGLGIFREAMKTKNYMWELQYAFPYANPAFVETYPALFKAWDGDDAAAAASLTATLRQALSPAEWEDFAWQMWKEGLARYLENRMREVLGLPENKGGEKPPFNRVSFYRGGDKLIRFLERRRPGTVNDLEKLYRAISGAPEPAATPAKPRAAR